MTTIIYIRTSTEEQNPENQLKECLSINKFGEHRLIEDKGSAWKDDDMREGFKEVIKEIKKGEVKDLIVWDWDRIYRNRKKLKAFFELCKVFKCRIHSYRQSWSEVINTIPEPFNEIMMEFLISMFGYLAQDESDKKSMRVRAAMRTKEDGVYSYKGNKWGRKELSTQAVNKILELRKEGKSMRDIQKLVAYSNKGNMRNVSLGAVHKVLSGQHRKIKIRQESSQVVS
jgi:DNA invertase Pin-like site-specific DNA recombinase